MYQNVKSRVKFNNVKMKILSVILVSVKESAYLTFLFSMFVNDLEEELISKNFEGLDLDNFTLFLLMYVDGIVWGVVGWCEGAVYLTSLGHPTDIGLQLGKTCYPCSG